jgi:Peptidase MA superfamily
MKTQEIKFTVLILLLIGIGFNEPIKGQSNGWSEEKQVIKTIDNVTFTIPVGGKAFDNKDALVAECFDAIKSNLELINIPKLKDSIYIRFLSDRNEMKRYTTTRSIGFTVPWTKTVYLVDSYKKGEVKAPIKHELMHLISNREWGRPPENSYWMNEGLAAYAENNCNNYDVKQIYRYFLGNKMLLSIDSLANGFYNQPEMIAYHQSAYIVEYLITNYGIKKFKELWKEGIDEFKKIYSSPISQILKDMEKVVIKKYPTSPDIDWEKFKKGCK